MQVYEFRGPRRYHDPGRFPLALHEERLLLVFPYLAEDILEERRLRKWMDQVVIPAIKGSLSASRL